MFVMNDRTKIGRFGTGGKAAPAKSHIYKANYVQTEPIGTTEKTVKMNCLQAYK